MFKSTDELKAFILWAKKEQLKQVKIGDIEFIVSDAALTTSVIDAITKDLSEPVTNPRFEPRPTIDKDGRPVPQEDPDLYFSVR
jgi:hypothetical protein